MKNNIIKILRNITLPAIVVSAMMVVLILAPGCGKEAGGAGRMKIAADIVPMADFCRAVGGEMVEVEILVPPGASPHAYELTTGQMRFLADADVMVTVGLGLTPWAEEILSKAGNPDLATVAAGDAIPVAQLIPAALHAQGGEAGEAAYDPHVWLDPNLARYIITAIRDALIQVDPQNALIYRENAAAYEEELAHLDAEIRGEMATLSSRKFIAFHSSWTYFAARYGLDQVGVIEEQPGKEPSAGEIAELVEKIESQGVRVVFAEPQFSTRAAEAIAEESGGGVVVEILDPLGDPDDPASDTYLEMMRGNLAIIVEALA
ncbi:MAG: zinc ABC transporter substrate-binding protein [Actinobacteria bacterium]|nr:zinc ABC transporter substrate-binding protein [Actinomycetota bacterium]